MKSSLLTIATIALLFSTSSAYGDQPNEPHITVYGTAVSQVTPDVLRWSIGVRNRGTDLESVARTHTQLVDDVLKFLRGMEIDSDRLQTANMRFDEDYKWDERERVRDGFIATTEISFEVADFLKYRELWMGLAKMSGVSVNRVDFDVSNRIELQDDTREKAVRAARRKAQSMAGALDMKLGMPLVIEEIQSPLNSWSSSVANTMIEVGNDAAPSDSNQPLAPGKIAIKMRMRVSFQIHKK